MDRRVLMDAIRQAQAEWESTIAELGEAGLERPEAVGRWRVRDLIAHFNGWDRWQLVQVRCAFTGEVPSESELRGGLELPEADPSLSFADRLNASFEAANRDRPLDSVLADWRELCVTRAEWVAEATDDQLGAVVGSDWSGTPGRYIRLQSEVPGVNRPTSAGQFILDQVEHQRTHLAEVRDWMAQAS